MACPANPQPPGPFDLAAPHSPVAIGGGIFLAIFLAASLICIVVLFRWGYRRQPPGPLRSLRLWISVIYMMMGFTVCVFMEVTALWGNALWVWYYPYFSKNCAAVDAVYRYASDRHGDLILVGGLLAVGNLILIALMFLITQKLTALETQARGPHFIP